MQSIHVVWQWFKLQAKEFRLPIRLKPEWFVQWRMNNEQFILIG